MVKSLQDAYKLATEDKDLEYYKNVLAVWQDEERSRAEERAEMEAEDARLAEERAKAAEDAENGEEDATKKEKKKKAPRKSKAADEDVEMEGAEAPKSSKKRKKAADSDGEDKVSFMATK